jgi:hypothetical protein
MLEFTVLEKHGSEDIQKEKTAGKGIVDFI